MKEVIAEITDYISNHPGCTRKELLANLGGKHTPAYVDMFFHQMSRDKVIFRGKPVVGRPKGYYLTNQIPEPVYNTDTCGWIQW